MGRRKKWAERMDARFPEGTLARLDAVLQPKEARTDFIYEAVEREIDRRDGEPTSAKPASIPIEDLNAENDE
jgi:hypothetical protein